MYVLRLLRSVREIEDGTEMMVEGRRIASRKVGII
jgi:hypothetical protein